jgi:hypothetical protein
MFSVNGENYVLELYLRFNLKISAIKYGRSLMIHFNNGLILSFVINI